MGSIRTKFIPMSIIDMYYFKQGGTFNLAYSLRRWSF